MKKFYLLIPAIFILFFQMYSDLFSQADLKDAIMNKITEMKEKAHLKALIAGVWKGDKEILTTALGESMTLVPATTDMHLRTGGVSETMMGTLVMILVDQGKIKLEDKLSKWFPDLLAADSVTIEMLIKNTTGYKDYVLNEDFINLVTKEPFRYISEEEIINYSVKSGQLNFRPGLKFEYSHTNFTILG